MCAPVAEGAAVLGYGPCTYVFDGEVLRVKNKLGEEIKVISIEVTYKVVVLGERASESGAVEKRAFRKVVRERIALEKKLGPEGVLELKLGPVHDLSEVRLYFEVHGREYAVECRPEA